MSRVPPSVPTSGPLNVETAWRAIVTDERNRWTDHETEREFWAEHAAEYESRFVDVPAGIDVLADLLSPDNAEIVPESWERADVSSHDIVVTGWSLYRQPNIGTCLDAILDAARKGFVIVDSTRVVPPHRRLAVERGDRTPSPPPRHAYFCALLADRGVYPEVRIERTVRERRAASRVALYEELLGDAVPDPERHDEALSPWLESDGDEWRYRYSKPAAVLVWTRETKGSDRTPRAGDPEPEGAR